MERRQKQRRHIVLAALILFAGACAPIDGALSQGSDRGQLQQNGVCGSQDPFDRWVCSQPQQHQDEARELQGLVNSVLRDIRLVATPEPGDLTDVLEVLKSSIDQLKEMKEVFEKHENRLKTFIKAARGQETRHKAEQIRHLALEPYIKAFGEAITRLTQATQGEAGECLSQLKGSPTRKAATKQDQAKTDELQTAILRLATDGVLRKDWQNVITITEHALGLLKQIEEWTLPGAREMYRAELLSHRGLAFLMLPTGDRAENFDEAIKFLQAAIEPGALKSCPGQQAIAQTNLGIAYANRIRGERAENHERAIAAYEAALTVQNEAFRSRWARTQINLGRAYLYRIRGKRAENMAQAIKAFEAALKVLTREAYPGEWAALQDSLGLAYLNQAQGDQGENIERAVTAFEDALTLRTRENPTGEEPKSNNPVSQLLPAQLRPLLEMLREMRVGELGFVHPPVDGWAWSKRNLGNAYQKRVHGNRAENIERAIAAYNDAIGLWTRETFPVEWGMTKSNLGEAYASQIRGDRAANIEKAIAAYQEALTTRTREAFPRDNLETAKALGQALNAKGDWHGALAAFEMARGSFHLLFGQGLNEAEARDLLQKAGPLFTDAAYAAAELGDAARALALLEEGRARLLALALKLKTLKLNPSERLQLEQLRRQIRDGEAHYQSAQGAERAAKIDDLVRLRTKLAQLVDSTEARSQAVTGRNILSRVAGLIPPGGALVAPIVAGPGGKLIIAMRRGRDTHLSVVDVPKFTSDRLDKILGARDRGGWLRAYGEQSRRSGEWRAAIDAAIDKVTYELGALVGRPLAEELASQGVKPGAPIIILPAGALGLLPLGLARDSLTRRYLMEDYTIAFAPSLAALASAKARPTGAKGQPTLAAIANPTEDLRFTAVESVLVESRFARGRKLVVREKAATHHAVLAALKDKDYWHFASHGSFDWDDPRASGLLLAEGKPLTVGDLLGAEGLRAPRLVVLSACETGLHEIATTPNEFIGLPAAFLQLGARGVLATLWLVDDFSTALLVAKFYDLHRKELVPPAEALRQAQDWLRTMGVDGFRNYVRDAVADGRLTESDAHELEKAIRAGRKRLTARATVSVTESGPEPEPPFAHPYYWGGFTLTGL